MHSPSPLSLFLLPIQHVLQQFTKPPPFPVSLGQILVICDIVIVDIVIVAMVACKEEAVEHMMVSVLLQRVSTIVVALTLIVAEVVSMVDHGANSDVP
jgi:hypothetical protein